MKNYSCLRSTLSFLFLSALLVSCKKDPIVDPNEGELITTVKLKLTEKTTNIANDFVFQDLDGEGGQAPQKFDEIILTKGKIYDCAITILNESVTPSEDITVEIIEEANDHQIYVTPSPTSLLSVANMSKDSNGFPLGVTSTLTVGSSVGNGTINVTLKHKPGIKTATDNVSVGETDIALDFKVKVL